jgi:RNA polymerase sigma-70 factor (ECF subfamily)
LTLFVPCQPNLRAFVRSLVWDRARCDDVLQEVALVLWREFERYDPDRSFGAWARGITAKVILKHAARDRRGPVPLSLEAIDVLQTAFSAYDAEGSEAEAALADCLQKLPQKSQVLVQLRYGHVLQLSEIAARVMSTPDAVQKALERIRAALQACVQRQLRSSKGTA